jgi:hypothetical protein
MNLGVQATALLGGGSRDEAKQEGSVEIHGCV